MDKYKLTEILLRYCKSIENAGGKTIITNYDRMRNYINNLNEKELGHELCRLCDTLAIKQALLAVKKGKISLKECSADWNGKAVAKGYQLAKEIAYLWKEHPKGKEKEEKMKELAEMAFDEPSIGTQLCLMELFFNGTDEMSIDEWKRLKELLEE